jgi:hypothetical protein
MAATLTLNFIEPLFVLSDQVVGYSTNADGNRTIPPRRYGTTKGAQGFPSAPERNHEAVESYDLMKITLPLPNPSVADSDEYLTNSHIFYKGTYLAINPGICA